MYGGSAAFVYHWVHYWMKHHDHTNLRPAFIDHQLAMSVLGVGFGAAALSGSPFAMFQGWLFFFFILGPIGYWLKLQGNKPGQNNRHSAVYYLDGTTEEEISRFRHQDQIEQLAHQMGAQPGYGYFKFDGTGM